MCLTILQINLRTLSDRSKPKSNGIDEFRKICFAISRKYRDWVESNSCFGQHWYELFIFNVDDDLNNCFACIVIVAELVDANNINDITFPDPNSNVSINNSILIPASYIQQRAMTTGKLST